MLVLPLLLLATLLSLTASLVLGVRLLRLAARTREFPELAIGSSFILAGVIGYAVLLVRPTQSIQAENLFLRRQLALFRGRGVQPRRIDAVTRISLAVLGRFCEWRDALFAVIEHGTGRLAHVNVTSNPSADWTLLQDGKNA